MRDPHVEFLLYSVSAEAGTEYVDPEPLEFENALGRFRIDGGELRVEPAAHFAYEHEAMAVIDPFLRAWEIEADLVDNPGTIRFLLKTVHIIDRDPAPPGSSRTMRAGGGAFELTGHDATLSVLRRSYPQPPTAFRVTSDVKTAFGRWRAYRDRPELLQSMAYAVLTLLQELAGGRRAAAQRFAVDPEILGKLGELTELGDDATTRKFHKHMRDLSGTEKAWIEKTVRRLIRRLGEHASGVALVQITTRDLPLP